MVWKALNRLYLNFYLFIFSVIDWYLPSSWILVAFYFCSNPPLPSNLQKNSISLFCLMLLRYSCQFLVWINIKLWITMKIKNKIISKWSLFDWSFCFRLFFKRAFYLTWIISNLNNKTILSISCYLLFRFVLNESVWHSTGGHLVSFNL